MELRTAAPEDLGKIMELIDQAKAFLKRNGVDQWQNGYPDQTCIEEDIRKGRGYLCIQDQDVVGYVCIDFEGEPAYDTLDGKWLSIQPYVVVHRLALDASVRGRGLASQVFEAAECLARLRGVHSFKVDTDNDNQIMKHLLEKNGFQFCGTICFDNSEKIAFEKLI